MPSPRRIRTPVSPARWATSSIISESRSPGPTGRRPCTCPTSAPIGPAPSSAQTFAEEEATMPLRAIPKTAAGPAPGEPVPTPYPYTEAPAFPTSIGTGPRGMPAHACMGLNSCKASDRFGLAGPPKPTTPAAGGCGGSSAPAAGGCGGSAAPAAGGCGGASTSASNSCGSGPTLAPNECAGQGYCSTASDHTCHVQNSCKDQGGCGLYGTDEELNRPGDNECRALGSCATPINAERFSTNGPNQRKSVWLRARAVFEEKWPAMRAELLARQESGELDCNQPLPETLGPPPALFAETGPTYLWISDDNKARGHMTACGSSGMSGAGGCS